MTRHATLVKELASRLRDLDVASVVYFHTDHFEPWRPVATGPAVGPEIVETIHEFCRVTERIDFARRLTLFYKPHLNYDLRKGGDLVRGDPEDLVGFVPRSDYEERMGREAMREVATASSHDIQLHIHHEYYTATTAHTDPVAVQWFSSPLGRSLDEKRLELAIRLNREIIGREAGRSSTRWFFVHGHWALNASDDTSCTITNEIELLLRHGCRGDFTFPAGRQHTNPRIKVPYLCSPFAAPKGYDRPEAGPEIACGNREAADRKFFIWASPASSTQCSLDYMSETTRRQLENTEKAARDLLENAYVADRRLYIKTHAHSVHPYYFEHSRSAVFPHQHPAVQTLLSVVFEAASQADMEVEFRTAPEVYDMLLAAAVKPDVDLADTYLRPPPRFRIGMPTLWSRSKSTANDRKRAPHKRVIAAEAGRQLVNDTAIEVLSKRIETLGEQGSGAYAHYSRMLQQGRLASDAELTAFEMIGQLRQAEAIEACHEIGSGLGILPFLLALDGFRSVGIESDARRHDTAQAIWQELKALTGADGEACRLVRSRFPALPRGVETRRSVAVLIDFVTTQTDGQVQAILGGLQRYPYVLVDLRRFCVVRATAADQQTLFERFRADGFELVSSRDAADAVLALLRNRRPAVETPPGRWQAWFRFT